MSNTERLIVSIVHFLGEQLRSDALSSDAKESLEVAIQCLESAYNVSSSDTHLMISKSLSEIFDKIAQEEPVHKSEEVSYDDKKEAERLKNEGNELMKQEKFEEALKNYTKAIQLDNRNPVYFCNRAAAYSRLNNHTFALEDCQRAIEIDPNYSKAYGRMGLAYASLNDHAKAKQFYEKAIELDPSNETFRNNFRIAEEKLKEQQRDNSFAGVFSNLNMESLMSNPAVVDFAQRIIRGDSFTQNMFSQMMGSFAQPGENADNFNPENSSNANADGASPNLSNFFRVGHQFVEQMQQTNPDLIEQIRRGFTRMNNPQGGNNDTNNQEQN